MLPMSPSTCIIEETKDSRVVDRGGIDLARMRGPAIKHGGWRTAVGSFLSVRWERGVPRLVVHEKYEAVVKWTLRVLTAIGILSALVALTPLGGLLLGVVMLVIEQFLERAVFEYTTIYVLPLPDYAYDGKSWIEMAFALPFDAEGNPDPDLPSLCCLVFDDRDQAEGAMRMFAKWAEGPGGHPSSNIVVSFVLEDFGGYTLYVYPNLEARNLEPVFEQIRKAQLEDKLGKQQQKLVMMLKLGKYFGIGPASHFQQFLDRHEAVQPEYLLGCYLKRDGTYEEILQPLWVPMTDYRLVERSALKDTEMEWESPASLRRLAKELRG